MNRRQIGWVFVVLQFVLLVGLIALPARDDWSDAGWVRGLGWAISAGGVVVVLVAARGLGPALTPTPVPAERGHLITSGLFRFVRHPIYTGVLLIVLGLVIRSSSIIALVVGVAICGFFLVKARWEESQLRLRYPEYDAYAESVPRFVPSPFRRK